MADHSVTLIVDAAEGGDLSAEAFVGQLDSFLKALAASDLEAGRGKKSVEWVVVKLNRSSPAVVRLEPRTRKRARASAPREAVEKFFDLLDGFQGEEEQRGTSPSVHRKTIRAFKSLGKFVERGNLTAIVENERRRERIRPVLTPQADSALAPTEFARGSVQGRLQWINTHGDDLLMWIYPWVGPTRIKCWFPEHLVEKAGDALDKWVVVHGTLRYPAHSRHPTEVEVDDLDALPDDAPRLRDLRGTMPDATSGQPAEDYIRKVRNDGW